jgi:acyl-CoA synthetase (AMP-forming)/AMP-acid ligase II
MRQRDPADMREWNKASPDDVWLVSMPVFHIGGSGVLVWASYNSGKIIITREFNPMSILDDFVKHRVSKLFLVPAALQFIVRLPQARQVDYSRLKFIMYGASPIPLDLLRECMDVFKCGFVQMYGMTETTGTIVALEPEDHTPEGSQRMRSAGKPLAGVEVAILDGEGKPLPVGEVGEIATRSLANMKGYWNLPEASRRTMTDDGWLRTGDAGYLDEDGYVYVHDRVKDMIISGAENIYPAEVESAIFGHPAIAEVAVIGVPDDKWGEAVKAVVVLKDGADVSPDEIIAFARTRIAGFKAPRTIDFIDALPRNPSGKILKRELREPYWAGKDRRVN